MIVAREVLYRPFTYLRTPGVGRFPDGPSVA
jgi:hypothetical protein